MRQPRRRQIRSSSGVGEEEEGGGEDSQIEGTLSRIFGDVYPKYGEWRLHGVDGLWGQIYLESCILFERVGGGGGDRVISGRVVAKMRIIGGQK